MATIDFSVLISFSLVWAAIALMPGPNILMVTHIALTRTPRHVALAIAGNLAGVVVIAGSALIGMTAVLEAFPWLRIGVNVAGGLYLMFFGFKLLEKARSSGPDIAGGKGGSQANTPAWRTMLLGFLTAMSNPHLILFVTSIFAVTGVLNASLATGIACIAAMLVINGSYLAVLGWLLLRPFPRRLYERFRAWVEGLTGTLFLFFGARLVLRALAGR